jgi:glutathione S-transferase
MALIYHIASAADWEQARRDGEYTTSTRGVSLAEQGFIHASTAPQVAPVANAFYGNGKDLVVLVIDTGRLGPELRYEPVPGWDDPFPHLYGPLNVDAVVTTLPLDRDASGRFAFSADGD